MIQKNQTAYLQRYSEIIKDLSVKYNISIKDIEFIIDFFFITFKRFIENIWMPVIRITNLGTFRPTVGRLNWHISIKQSILRKGCKNPDLIKERLDHYLKVRDRLVKERSGENTWKEWRSKLKIEDNANSKKENKKQKT